MNFLSMGNFPPVEPVHCLKKYFVIPNSFIFKIFFSQCFKYYMGQISYNNLSKQSYRASPVAEINISKFGVIRSLSYWLMGVRLYECLCVWAPDLPRACFKPQDALLPPGLKVTEDCGSTLRHRLRLRHHQYWVRCTPKDPIASCRRGRDNLPKQLSHDFTHREEFRRGL